LFPFLALFEDNFFSFSRVIVPRLVLADSIHYAVERLLVISPSKFNPNPDQFQSEFYQFGEGQPRRRKKKKVGKTGPFDLARIRKKILWDKRERERRLRNREGEKRRRRR
jgi:hypothetical protein